MCAAAITEGEALRIEELEGRGRGLITTKPVKGGEIILRDSPLLLYSALPSNEENNKYCHNCFKRITSTSSLTTCTHNFCSLRCYSSSIVTSHNPWVCDSLTRLSFSHSSLPRDLLLQVRFLIAAYNLSVISPPSFNLLLSLQGNHNGDTNNSDSVRLLHSIIVSLSPPLPNLSLEMTSALLAKDKLNAFGLMESKEKRWSVRAYGIYPKASLFNHDCLPNACRFDYVDEERDNNTEIVVRMIHDVPVGREICLSYFPVNLNYSERQKRLLEDYGFRCCCDRCRVEANWSDNEDGEEEIGDNEDNENEEEAMEEDFDEEMGDGEVDNDVGLENSDFPHAYFFARYMCDCENCFGTLAPLPPMSPSSVSDLLECNVCGNIKKDEVVAANANSGRC